MSWKEKRLITLLSVILAVLCAAVLLVLSGRYRAAQAAKAEQEETGDEAAAQTSQDDYVALSYNNGATSLSFAQNEGGAWYWESEPEFPLNDGTVTSILALLKSLKPQQTLDLPEDLSAYGLDDPQITLTASTRDGASVEIDMGNTTTDGGSYYALISSDPGHLFIIPDTLYQAMETPIYEMCVLPDLPVLKEETMTSLLIQGPRDKESDTSDENSAGARVTTVLTAVSDDGGQISWRSGGANVTDTADVRALMEDLAGLRLSRCVDFHPSDEAASFCGFDNPSTLTVEYRTATGAEETFVMDIGNQNMDGTGRYVRVGGESAVYLVELSLLDPLMRLAYQGLEGSAA